MGHALSTCGSTHNTGLLLTYPLGVAGCGTTPNGSGEPYTHPATVPSSRSISSCGTSQISHRRTPRQSVAAAAHTPPARPSAATKSYDPWLILTLYRLSTHTKSPHLSNSGYLSLLSHVLITQTITIIEADGINDMGS